MSARIPLAAFIAALALFAAGPATAETASSPVAFGPAAPQYAAGELLVAYESEASAAERRELRREIDAEVAAPLPIADTQLLEVAPGAVEEAVSELGADPDVAYAQPNYIRTAATVPNDPKFNQLWGLDNSGQVVNGSIGSAGSDIGALHAWDRQTGSAQTTIAIVDTGVMSTHPDLSANIWSNPKEAADNGKDDDGNGLIDDKRGWDFVDDDATPSDPNGHGTHVAGIAAAAGNNGIGVTGVSWRAKLMPLRVLGANGSGTDSDIAAAFRYAAAAGADVVNASLGGTGDSPAIADAVRDNPETLFVVAAGNEGVNNDLTPYSPCTIAAVNLICVAATNSSDDLAGFSNYGATSVDLAAPGTSILSTFPPNTTEAVWSDDFESDRGWSSGGSDPWSRSGEAYSSPSNSLTDSTGNDYPAGADSWAKTAAIDLGSRSGCMVQLVYLAELGSGDTIDLEASTNNSSWTRLERITDSGNGQLTADAAGFEHSDARFRIHLQSDGSGQADGVYVDDFTISCQAAGATYGYSSGTSMATPYVSGAAAVLVAEDPSATVAELRRSLLAGAEPLPALAGKLAQAGRLDLDDALNRLAPAAPDLLAPQTQIDSAPALRTRSRKARFIFTANESSSFECKLDRDAFKACSSPRKLRVSRGRHTLRVVAIDDAGNRDATPARYRWRVLSR